MTLEEWLETQRKLQVEAFKLDPVTLEGEALGSYVVWNAWALVDELSELMGEVQWKPWSANQGMIISRERAYKEFVDIMHFLGNIALALKLDGDVIATEYAAKAQVNRDRQERGYDAVTEKCRECRRDLGETGIVTDTKQLDGLRITVRSCGACGSEIGRDIS